VRRDRQVGGLREGREHDDDNRQFKKHDDDQSDRGHANTRAALGEVAHVAHTQRRASRLDIHMTPTFYIGLVLVVVTWALLSHTSFGLAVTAVGEDPSAADKAGVDVNRSRYLAVLYAGAMAGVAGAFLSVADLDTFTEGMTKGAGYLALASVIFGGWTSWRTAVACLLFGAATALQFLLPDLGISVPVPLLLMLPYVMALLAVGGLVGNIRTPSALGIPFIRGC
jgi:general nucleoside transport system permease protein